MEGGRPRRSAPASAARVSAAVRSGCIGALSVQPLRPACKFAPAPASGGSPLRYSGAFPHWSFPEPSPLEALVNASKLRTLSAAGVVIAAVVSLPRPASARDPVDTLFPPLSGVHDPGPRGGSPGAGGPVSGLTDSELALFKEGQFRASELEATCDTCSDVPPGTPIPPGSPPDTTNSAGLGGRFNSDQCLACHSHPAAGGTSPAINPSFAIASRKGATNKVPFFERRDGPTREVRFLFHDDGSRDGSVHQKFTVAGRKDAPDCTLAQPDFERAAEINGLALRIP